MIPASRREMAYHAPTTITTATTAAVTSPATFTQNNQMDDTPFDASIRQF